MIAKDSLLAFGRVLASPRVRFALLILVLAFCAYGLYAEWPRMQVAFGELQWYSLVGSTLAAMAGAACMMLAWRAVLADLGSRLPLRTAVRVNFLAQLGKYVPGAVWSVAAMVELGHDHDVPRRRGAASVATSVVIGIGVGLAVSGLALPLATASAARHYLWVMAVLPATALCLYPPVLGWLVDRALLLARMQPLDRRFSVRGLAVAVVWTTLGWLLLGLQVWIVMADVSSDGERLLFVALGAYAFAYSAALLLVVVPAGIGSRELILVAVLAPVLPHGTAVVIALAARATTTVCDLAFGALALVVGRSARNTSAGRLLGRHRRSPAVARGSPVRAPAGDSGHAAHDLITPPKQCVESGPNGSQDLAELVRDWTRLGEQDPLWAVCVDRAKRGGHWEVNDFLETGREEIAHAMARLADLGICASRRDALDFGCGVGRVSVALSSYFHSVTAVDIAPSMIDYARRLHAVNTKCRFLLNDQANLGLFEDASFDLVYSGLVLQHMPPVLADSYIREFVRVVRPGGAIVLLVPEAHRRTPRGLVYAHVPRGLVGWIQMAMFSYPAPMRMERVPAQRIHALLAGDARILASEPYPIPDCHWRMVRHFIEPRPPGHSGANAGAASRAN